MHFYSIFTLIWTISAISNSDNDSKHCHITIMSIQQNKNNKHLSIGILTEIPNSFKLINPQILEIPDINPHNLQFNINNDINDNNVKCTNDLYESGSMSCYQSFIISSNNVNKCPVDLEGIFKLSFDVVCSNDPCDNELNQVYALTDRIQLDARITYKDEICNRQIFNVNGMTRKMRFYKTEKFETEMNDDELYDINDICFVQIEINYPLSSTDDTFNKFNIKLENVWLCTSPPQNNDLFSFSKQGCFQHGIIDQFQEGPYWIVNNGNGQLFGAEILKTEKIINTETNKEMTIIRFKFQIPEIQRDTLHIHTQLSLEFAEQQHEQYDHMHHDNRRRVLLLLQNKGIMATYITVMGATKVDIPIIIIPFDNIRSIHNYNIISNEWMLFVKVMVALVIISCFILIISMRILNNNQTNNELEQNNNILSKRKRIRIRKDYHVRQQRSAYHSDNSTDTDEYDDFEDLLHDNEIDCLDDSD